MQRILILIAILLWSTLARAETICESLQKNDASLDRNDATCAISTLLDGTEQSTCYWTYLYRSTVIYARFEELRLGIEKCLGSGSALPDDQTVNHPDSFVLYRYEGQGIRVSLSLKDKAALKQSLIFVSLSPAP